MQTKLFESPDAQDNLSTPPIATGKGQSCAPAAIVIRTSRSAIFGLQRNEFWIQNGHMEIGFADLVRESAGHDVIPIDPLDWQDAQLLQHLFQAMDAFMKLTVKSGQRFTGRSINEVGKRFEYMVAEALSRSSIQASVLGRPGYPDCVLKQGDRVTYLEIKTSASVQKEANRFFKTFSFCSGKKIRFDARHLLLKVQLEEEDDKIWKVIAWELRDLSALKTRLKTEFNAGLADIAAVRVLGSSAPRGSTPRLRDQAILEEAARAETRTSVRQRVAS